MTLGILRYTSEKTLQPGNSSICAADTQQQHRYVYVFIFVRRIINSAVKRKVVSEVGADAFPPVQPHFNALFTFLFLHNHPIALPLSYGVNPHLCHLSPPLYLRFSSWPLLPPLFHVLSVHWRYFYEVRALNESSGRSHTKTWHQSDFSLCCGPTHPSPHTCTATKTNKSAAT